MYYNHSYINKSDGIDVYINKHIISTRTTEVIDKLSFLNITLNLKEGRKLKITSLYRYHNITEK